MDHLTAGQLAGYLDEHLPGDRREEVERHLDACPACRAELVELGRLVPGGAGSGARAGPMARAWRWGIPMAAAAVVGALALFRSGEPGAGPVALERPGGGGAEVTSRVAVVAPRDGASVPRDNVAFTWLGRGPGTYRLTVLTQAGELVWTLDTADTVAIPPASLPLAPGNSYFWRVEVVADGITASSEVRRFEIVP